MPCEELATTPDELVVERLNAAPLGSRELLRTGRIGTKVGLTGDGRSILMDQRGELLCVHGEANTMLRKRANNRCSLVCNCRPFDLLVTKHVRKNDAYTYGLRDDEMLFDFLKERRTPSLPVHAFADTYIAPSGCVVCKCGKAPYTLIRRDNAIISDIKAILSAHNTPSHEALDQIIATSKRPVVAAFLAWSVGKMPFPKVTSRLSRDGLEPGAWAEVVKSHSTDVPPLEVVIREANGCVCAGPRIIARDGSYIRYDSKSKTLPTTDNTGRRVRRRLGDLQDSLPSATLPTPLAVSV